MFQEFSKIKESGFSGFKTIAQLWDDHTCIPNEPGVYLVLNPDCLKSKFLSNGVGGYFKSKNPNVSIDKLQAKWIENCHVLYIGQAGGNSSSATLKKRLRQYLDFGKGKPIGHYGGRFIWQIAHHPELVIAWKICKEIDPRTVERNLLLQFTELYGKLPGTISLTV